MARLSSFLQGTMERRSEGGDDPPVSESEMVASFGNTAYPPGESWRQHLNQASPRPDYLANVEALAQGVRDRPNFSVAPSSSDDDDIDDFGGGDFAPSAPAETSEWVEQPQANPFAPSAPLPTGPQPTSHPWSPPEQQMGPPSAPEYNPLAGLPDPYIPPYARPGAQPTPGPGSPEYLAQYAPTSTTTEMQYDSYGNVVPNSGGTTVGENLTEDQQEALAVQANAQNMMEIPPDIAEAQQIAADREAQAAAGGDDDDDDGGGSLWSTLNDLGQGAIDTISRLNPIRPPVLRPTGGGLVNANPPQAPEDMPLTGTVIRTIEDAQTLGGLGLQFANAAVTNPTEILRDIGTAQAAIRRDPGVVLDVGSAVGSQMWHDFLEHPEDAAIGAAITAATGGGFVGARLASRWGRGAATVATHADDVAEAAVPVARTINAAEDAADAAEAAATAGRNLPGVSDVAGPATNIAGDTVDAQHAANAAQAGASAANPGRNQFDVLSSAPTPSPAAATPAPSAFDPLSSATSASAPSVNAAGNAADAAAPAARQLDVLSSAPAPRNQFDVLSSAPTPTASRQLDVLDSAPAPRNTPSTGYLDEAAQAADNVPTPHYEMPDVPTRQVADVAEDVADTARQLPTSSGLSLEQMAAAGEQAADVAEDVADTGRTLSRTDAWLAGKVERRLQRRSDWQPTNVARRIVGREPVYKPYTWGQRQMTRLGDKIAGGPGTEGSPNLLRQYVANRVRQTDTMPEFPEGTSRGYQAAERAAWRHNELVRPLRRAENAADAVGNTVDNVHDAAEFVRNPLGALDIDWGEQVGGSIYGDEDVITAAPKGWKRPTNPRFASAATAPTNAPASQAYGQQTYVAGRGYRGM